MFHPIRLKNLLHDAINLGFFKNFGIKLIPFLLKITCQGIKNMNHPQDSLIQGARHHFGRMPTKKGGIDKGIATLSH
jgi:hypothetical protein